MSKEEKKEVHPAYPNTSQKLINQLRRDFPMVLKPSPTARRQLEHTWLIDAYGLLPNKKETTE